MILRKLLPVSLAVAMAADLLPAQRRYQLHSFQKQQLEKEFFCEGASFGDLNRDGKPDVISGPYWYEGPEFKVRHAFYPPKPFDKKRYSKNFFVFVYDFDGDQWNDILVIGFPGQDASWYRNPQGKAGHWQRHQVFDRVDNESPTFTDITGDGKPELICQTNDHMGYATVNWRAPAEKWTFHPISDKGIGGRFTHGLGVGDIDGDGRKDILWKLGWWQQPASLDGNPKWQRHLYNFAGRGGAQMLVYDIDGDGDNDVVSSYNAHGYGLFWFEQQRKAGKITFARHRIMGQRPQQSRYGVVFGNLHALCLVDMDRDGLMDVVTGNRYWAHGGNDPADREKAPVYWFKLARTSTGKGAHFVPHVIDAHSGVGTQVVAGDVTGDGYPEVIVGNKMGTFVHRHEVRQVSRNEWFAKRREFLKKAAAASAIARKLDRSSGYLPKGADGKPLNLDFETGTLQDWKVTGEAFAEMPVKGDTVKIRLPAESAQQQGTYWIGGYEPRRSDRAKGRMESLPFVVSDRYGSFLIGGGRYRRTRMELVRADNNKVIYEIRGESKEPMRPAVVDLKEHLGKPIFIRLVDDLSGGWGHINFDDFRLHKEDPRKGQSTSMVRSEQKDGFLPKEAAARMSVPEGFHVDLIAGEPDLHQPIGFCIDEKGRLWVAEAHSYPVRKRGDKAKDKILVFSDEDGDGSYETRKTFIDNLNLISGLEVGFGGVWVGAAPYLMFIPDRDGDLVPDAEPQILLDGWGYEDTHETLNAFIWGPDGWLYGCHGVFTHSRVGKPGTPDKDRQRINAGVWRYHPTRHEFEVFAWGTSNPWGVDFNDLGQAFITACVIPHLWHVIQGGRYHRQAGRHFNRYVYEDIKTIADHLHYIGARPHAGNGVSDTVGGGHAHCGAMVYLGDRFPEQYRNVVFMGNIHGNRLNTDILTPDGSGYVGSHGPDFLLANDKWFRGINYKYGPTGDVFMIDWYDKQACHRRTPEIWDRTNGRMYRIRYGEAIGAAVDLSSQSSAELCALQLHDNDWYVRRARRVLMERGPDPAVHAALDKLISSQKVTAKRLRALWSLHVTGGLDAERSLALLADADEHIRAWTVQLICEHGALETAQRDRLAEMAQQDRSQVVRLYLASAMQRIKGDLRWRLAAGLLARAEDEGDHNLPLMYWYGFEPLVAEDPARALPLIQSAALDKLRRFGYRRMAAVARTGPQALVGALAASEAPAEHFLILREMVTTLKRQANLPMPEGWTTLYPKLARSANPSVREDALTLAVQFGDRQVLPTVRAVVQDAAASLDRRKWALDNLVRSKDQEAVPALQKLVGDNKLGDAVIRGLASFDHPGTAALLISGYGAFSSRQQQAAIATLCSRASYAKALLSAIEAGKVPKAVLDTATTRRRLRGMKDEAVDALLARTWGRFRPTSADKQAEIDKWKGILSEEYLAKANLHRGRALYGQTCMACHKLFGEGGILGPDITGSNRGNVDYLLDNILDPSAEVARQYQMTTVETKDGGFFAGMIAQENDSTLTLRDAAGGEQQINKADIAKDEQGKPKIQTLANSMMPEGQLAAMDKDQVRDLIAYLRSDKQVPMLATEMTLPQFFNGTDLSMWKADPQVWSVEDGELVGRTKTGLKRNSFALSDLLFDDFRLIFEVKLVDNKGNSGIQIRSKPHGEDSVEGPQCDIGVGWWGKIYEEHGRGLLAKKSGDHAIKPGQWTTYEILAQGSRIRTVLNGVLISDLDDPKVSRRGQIAPQVHSGGPTEVRFRNFRFELDPEGGPKTLR